MGLGASGAGQLTLDQPSDGVEADNHTDDTCQRLFASSNEVEHVAAGTGHGKRPAAENHVDLSLSLDFGDPGLSENPTEIVPESVSVSLGAGPNND